MKLSTVLWIIYGTIAVLTLALIIFTLVKGFEISIALWIALGVAVFVPLLTTDSRNKKK